MRVLYYIYASSGFGPLGPEPWGGNNVIAWFLVKFEVFENLTCFFPNCTRYHAITYKYIRNNKESDSYNSYIYCGFSKVKENIFIFNGFLYNIRIDLKTNFILNVTTARYLGRRPEKSHRDFPMLIRSFNICRALKPGAHEKKQLRKWPGKAVCSAVSFFMRHSFCGNCGERIEIKKVLSQSLQSPLVFYPYF